DAAPFLAGAMRLRPLGWVGQISYSVYLCHFALFVILRPHLPQSPAIQLIVLVTVALAAGAVFHAAVGRAGPSLHGEVGGRPHRPATSVCGPRRRPASPPPG